ncbi:hypothetical protein H7J73_09900 [Mycolicibacterium komossense]|uniref:Secreted protein n=1 Tax=Mycolicibacterium komossense TaxID=1779 RepID=A0ABT3CA76_9MYCO|nr:hypothetical protein [Mycolicibacterium komossense]MCV7226341.1 hypothetical protein [Mycolicibacterium komossense]
MIRELTIALSAASAVIGVAAATVTTAPTAAAAPAQDMADVPNMVYGVELSTACYSWERFIFGRGATGQTYACHYIPNQWPPVDSGFWVWSPPLYGVQTVGAPCPQAGKAMAQTVDGLALECAGAKGWQQDFYA